MIKKKSSRKITKPKKNTRVTTAKNSKNTKHVKQPKKAIKAPKSVSQKTKSKATTLKTMNKAKTAKPKAIQQKKQTGITRVVATVLKATSKARIHALKPTKISPKNTKKIQAKTFATRAPEITDEIFELPELETPVISKKNTKTTTKTTAKKTTALAKSTVKSITKNDLDLKKELHDALLEKGKEQGVLTYEEIIAFNEKAHLSEKEANDFLKLLEKEHVELVLEEEFQNNDLDNIDKEDLSNKVELKEKFATSIASDDDITEEDDAHEENSEEESEEVVERTSSESSYITDGVKCYLRDIGKIPLLNKTTEKVISDKIANSKLTIQKRITTLDSESPPS